MGLFDKVKKNLKYVNPQGWLANETLGNPLDSLTGGSGAGAERGLSEEQIREILKMYENTTPPELADVEFDKYKAVDPLEYNTDFNTSLVGSHQQGDTALENVHQDARLQDIQSQALQSLIDRGNLGGLTPQDTSRLDSVQDEAAMADKGRRQAILQNMQMRGMGGSGNELLAQLQSSQAATDRQNNAGLDIASHANEMALQSLIDSGNMARGMDQDKLALSQDKASAQDAINNFNTSLMMNQDRENTGIKNDVEQWRRNNQNDASLKNWGNNQSIANMNTGVNNEQITYNKGLEQDRFDNKMSINSNIANSRLGMANVHNQNAQSKAAAQSGKMGALGSVAGGLAGAFFGGPAGAAAGSQIGGSLAGGNSSGGSDWMSLFNKKKDNRNA